jgi:hypothetical protein
MRVEMQVILIGRMNHVITFSIIAPGTVSDVH